MQKLVYRRHAGQLMKTHQLLLHASSGIRSKHAVGDRRLQHIRLPAYYNTFKWISEALHEDERPEMFLLELHPRLAQIRKDRYRAQIALQNQIFEHRANAKITDPFETILGPLYQGAAKFSKSFNLFKKLLG